MRLKISPTASRNIESAFKQIKHDEGKLPSGKAFTSSPNRIQLFNHISDTLDTINSAELKIGKNRYSKDELENLFDQSKTHDELSPMSRFRETKGTTAAINT